MTTPDYDALAAQITNGLKYGGTQRLEAAFLACYAALQAAQAETQRAVKAERELCAREIEESSDDAMATYFAAVIREGERHE